MYSKTQTLQTFPAGVLRPAGFDTSEPETFCTSGWWSLDFYKQTVSNNNVFI